MNENLNFGCSCFSLTSKQKNVYWFRTCDMNDVLNVWKTGSQIMSIPKDIMIKFQNIKEIKNKYNILGVTFGNSKTRLLDGMNDKGLVGGLLFLLEGTSINQEEKEEIDSNYIQIEGMEFLTYILARM